MVINYPMDFSGTETWMDFSQWQWPKELVIAILVQTLMTFFEMFLIYIIFFRPYRQQVDSEMELMLAEEFRQIQYQELGVRHYWNELVLAAIQDYIENNDLALGFHNQFHFVVVGFFAVYMDQDGVLGYIFMAVFIRVPEPHSDDEE